MDMRYDFSVLSKDRLRTYNQLADEIERMEHAATWQDGVRELSDAEIEMLSAAGTPTPQNLDNKNPLT